MTLPSGLSSLALQATSQAGVGVFEWSFDDETLTWDETLARLYQQREGETPLETFLQRVHPDDLRGVQESAARLEATENVYRIVLRDGTVRHILNRSTYVVMHPDGRPDKVVGVVMDITAFQAAGSRLALTLESMSDGFVAMDRRFRLTYVNAQAERLLGLRREDVLGRVLREVFPHTTGTRFQAVYERVMQDRVPESFEEYYPDPLHMWIEVRAQPTDEGIVVYFQDATTRRAEQEERERLVTQLAHEAAHDGLTGLLNRSELERRAKAHLESDPQSLTAMFMDLDRFKFVNDSLGHAAGDALLVEVARRLPPLVGDHGIVARLGGDEFVVLLFDRTAEQAQETAQRLLTAVREPAAALGHVVRTSASVGLATAGPGSTVHTLLRDADVALYRAKDAGRDQLAWFDADAHRALLDRLALEADLREAVDAGSVQLHYQPTFDLGTGRVLGVEALARWEHPGRGAVPPDVFFPLAEDTGLIGPLAAHVLRLACEQAARWAALPDFVVWVNVSGRQLDRPGLAETVLGELSRAGVPPHRFGVEMTESVLMDEKVAAVELAALAGAGVSVAIDDFGTGYSSLSRLAALPLHVLKIDRSFTADLGSQRGRATVDVVVHLARAYGLRTIVEGVETAEQLQAVRAAGCGAASGYLLGRPAPADALQLGQARAV